MEHQTKEHQTEKATTFRAWARALSIAPPIAAAGLGGCGRSQATPVASSDAEAAPIAVKLVAAETVKAPRVVTLSGSLIGAEEADVAAGAAGKVLATYVERGSNVKKGAVLARLDARAVAAQAAQAARRRGVGQGPGGASAARLRARRATQREGGHLQGRLRQGPHPVPDHQVVGGVGRCPQDADGRGAARYRDPRAVRRRGGRAGGDRGRVRARRDAGGHAGQHRLAARRDHRPRGQRGAGQARDAGRLPDRRRQRRGASFTARSATSDRPSASRARLGRRGGVRQR